MEGQGATESCSNQKGAADLTRPCGWTVGVGRAGDQGLCGGAIARDLHEKVPGRPSSPGAISRWTICESARPAASPRFALPGGARGTGARLRRHVDPAYASRLHANSAGGDEQTGALCLARNSSISACRDRTAELDKARVRTDADRRLLKPRDDPEAGCAKRPPFVRPR